MIHQRRQDTGTEQDCQDQDAERRQGPARRRCCLRIGGYPHVANHHLHGI